MVIKQDNGAMKNKRLFISGGAGVIGQELVELLLRQGAEVFVGDLKPCPHSWLEKSGLHYRQGDLNNLQAAELQDFAPEIFWHLAATFERSVECYTFYSENALHNLFLSNHLLGCAVQCPSLKKLVFASSYLIYDPALYLFSTPQTEAVALHEKCPISARNLCGAAKYYHERELNFFTQFPQTPFNSVAARIFRVYGKGSKDIISRWVRSALKGESIQLYGAANLFDYIYAQDVASGLLKLAQLPTAKGIVNLGSGQSHAVAEVVAILKEIFPQLQIEDIAAPQCYYEASQAAMTQFFQLTDWRPSYQLKQGIQELVAYEEKRLNASHTHPQSRCHPPAKRAVLITSIGQKVPMLKAVRAAMKKIGQMGLLHGADCSPHCLASYFVDRFWLGPSDLQLTVEELTHYCQANNIGYIIPSRGAELLFYASHQKELKEAGIHVMVSAKKPLLHCLDKLLFAQILLAEGFPAIATSSTIDELPEICHYASSSYVVKERFGSGAKSTGLALCRQAALQWAGTVQNPIFQPFIDGKEWSIDLYLTKEGKVRAAVARQRNLIVNGESQVTTTQPFARLEQLCTQMAEKLQLRGHILSQAIEEGDGTLHIMECNPRFGGASTASVAAGLDSFYWFFLECQDFNLERLPLHLSKKPIKQVRAPCDCLLPD